MTNRKGFLMTTEEKSSFCKAVSKWYLGRSGWEEFFKNWKKDLKKRSDGAYISRVERNEIYGDTEIGLTLMEITYLRGIRWRAKDYILAFILVMNGLSMYDITHLVFKGNHARGSGFMDWAVKKGLCKNVLGSLVCSRRRWSDPLGWRIARFEYLKKNFGKWSGRKFERANSGEGFYEAIVRLQFHVKAKCGGSFILKKMWDEVCRKEPINPIGKVEDFAEASMKKYGRVEDLLIDFLGGERDFTELEKERDILGRET